ncbi:N-acylglucosamine 2-epimerase [Pseudoalteromonas porphyrae]|uniref:AGE family epimerase/isomerase n=1 Tax=Pseudoalteromonas TaxID=53246 RepID=UPI0006BAA46F|nr:MULTISPECIES: AGE family epimerase/isomerase [Pseudoalteromonas]KPH95831.1 N-acylglucosamine 2-epimerase [Pseudoalteromonas porphyrae]
MLANFQSCDFLQEHIKTTLNFYHPHCVDKQDQGGFYHFYKDDGTIYDRQTRHLVSSTRFVFNYAMAYLEFADERYLPLIQHGLDHLENAHKQSSGGYAWLIKSDDNKDLHIVDDTNHCYGLAFVLLANAVALKAGFSECKHTIERVWQLLESKYYQSKYNAYLDEINGDFSIVDEYRGQNANMHLCEALLMCYEATQDKQYLNRAETLALTFTIKNASRENGLVWEHYNSQWQIDWQYNLDDPKHLFRPWGFQPGHQTEWSKLLLILNRHKPQAWLIERAEHLFNTAMEHAWDNTYGGICYGFAPDGSICDDDKYFWVQAESFAAAALLAQATGNEKYWHWYDKIWQYSWQHMVDHTHGAWYRILTNDNKAYNDEKSPAGKTDYHTMGACYEVLRAFKLAKGGEA